MSKNAKRGKNKLLKGLGKRGIVNRKKLAQSKKGFNSKSVKNLQMRGKKMILKKKNIDKIRRQESKARLKAAEEAEKRREEREDEEKARKKMIKNRKFNRSKRGKAYNAARRASLSGAKGLGKVGAGGFNLIKRGATTGTALGKKGLTAAGKKFKQFTNSRTNVSKLGRNACFKEYLAISKMDHTRLNAFDRKELRKLNNIMQNSGCKNSKSMVNPIARAKALITGTTFTRQEMKKLLKKVVKKNQKNKDKNNKEAVDEIRRSNSNQYTGKDLFLKF